MTSPRQISGFSNPEVKRARRLREKKFRRREGLFLAEGLRILTEARETGHLPVQLWHCRDRELSPLAEELIAATLAQGGDVIETEREILAKISGKDNAQTLVGIYRDIDLPLDRLDRAGADIWLVAQAIRDPGNLGTILRTGDAVGAGGLILIDDCVDPFSVEAVRASMGAVFTQAVVRTEWSAFVGWLRDGPGQLVGASLDTDLDYQAAHYAAPAFILVGNESQGLPPEYGAKCDLLVKMPMRGRADSLNAAMATAVLSYEVLNQFRAT